MTTADALSAHAEMSAAYEDAGVRVHRLEPDPALSYQVFSRDSSIWTSAGPIVTQLHQSWRRGEYAPVIRFYEEAGIEISHMVTAGAFEGGDVVLPAPRCALIGHCEERTQEPAARQVAGWLEELGWEVRLQPFDPHFVHIDVLVCIAAPGLAVICEEGAPDGLADWLLDKGLELLTVSYRDAMRLGANVMALGRDRVLSTAAAANAQRAPASDGLHRVRPRPLALHDGRRRSPLPRSAVAPRRLGCAGLSRVDPARVIADLRELDRRTGGPGGARRVCWTDGWRTARELLRELLDPLPVEVSVDGAGNLWAVLEGRRPDAVAVGSHLDSVPAGGWLDGALGVMAAVEVLRAHAGEQPERTVALVDWADEEGARFGRSLLGSSAFAGTLDLDAVRGLVDAEGVPLPAALAEHGVTLDEIGDSMMARVSSACIPGCVPACDASSRSKGESRFASSDCNCGRRASASRN